MSVIVEDNGRRSVQAEVEVPGSPQEVWQAVATGPGISSWFVPTEVEERVGGKFTANFGPGMESESTITQWDPPHSFTKDGDGMDPDSPPVATEWMVEAKSSGQCTVRVVHSWFANTEEWDGQWESVEQGWVSLFQILRLKLQHFPGMPSAAFDVTSIANGTEAEVWEALTSPLGLKGATVGSDVKSQTDAPGLAGKVALVGSGGTTELMLLTSEPGEGICHASAMPMGEQVYLSVRFYLFGESAADVVDQAQPEWATWFAERFPAEAMG